MQMWWNWQTRKIQVLMVAIPCRFKSCHLHQKNNGERLLSIVFFRYKLYGFEPRKASLG